MGEELSVVRVWRRASAATVGGVSKRFVGPHLITVPKGVVPSTVPTYMPTPSEALGANGLVDMLRMLLPTKACWIFGVGKPIPIQY